MRINMPTIEETVNRIKQSAKDTLAAIIKGEKSYHLDQREDAKMVGLATLFDDVTPPVFNKISTTGDNNCVLNAIAIGLIEASFRKHDLTRAQFDLLDHYLDDSRTQALLEARYSFHELDKDTDTLYVIDQIKKSIKAKPVLHKILDILHQSILKQEINLAIQRRFFYIMQLVLARTMRNYLADYKRSELLSQLRQSISVTKEQIQTLKELDYDGGQIGPTEYAWLSQELNLSIKNFEPQLNQAGEPQKAYGNDLIMMEKATQRYGHQANQLVIHTLNKHGHWFYLSPYNQKRSYIFEQSEAYQSAIAMMDLNKRIDDLKEAECKKDSKSYWEQAQPLLTLQKSITIDTRLSVEQLKGKIADLTEQRDQIQEQLRQHGFDYQLQHKISSLGYEQNLYEFHLYQRELESLSVEKVLQEYSSSMEEIDRFIELWQYCEKYPGFRAKGKEGLEKALYRDYIVTELDKAIENFCRYYLILLIRGHTGSGYGFPYIQIFKNLSNEEKSLIQNQETSETSQFGIEENTELLIVQGTLRLFTEVLMREGQYFQCMGMDVSPTQEDTSQKDRHCEAMERLRGLKILINPNSDESLSKLLQLTDVGIAKTTVTNWLAEKNLSTSDPCLINGETLLHWAVNKRNFVLVQALYHLGIDPNVKNWTKASAIRLSEEHVKDMENGSGELKLIEGLTSEAKEKREREYQSLKEIDAFIKKNQNSQIEKNPSITPAATPKLSDENPPKRGRIDDWLAQLKYNLEGYADQLDTQTLTELSLFFDSLSDLFQAAETLFDQKQGLPDRKLIFCRQGCPKKLVENKIYFYGEERSYQCIYRLDGKTYKEAIKNEDGIDLLKQEQDTNDNAGKDCFILGSEDRLYQLISYEKRSAENAKNVESVLISIGQECVRLISKALPDIVNKNQFKITALKQEVSQLLKLDKDYHQKTISHIKQKFPTFWGKVIRLVKKILGLEKTLDFGKAKTVLNKVNHQWHHSTFAPSNNKKYKKIKNLKQCQQVLYNCVQSKQPDKLAWALDEHIRLLKDQFRDEHVRKTFNTDEYREEQVKKRLKEKQCLDRLYLTSQVNNNEKEGKIECIEHGYGQKEGTLLTIACLNFDVESVRLLLEKGYANPKCSTSLREGINITLLEHFLLHCEALQFSNDYVRKANARLIIEHLINYSNLCVRDNGSKKIIQHDLNLNQLRFSDTDLDRQPKYIAPNQFHVHTPKSSQIPLFFGMKNGKHSQPRLAEDIKNCAKEVRREVEKRAILS